MGNHRIDYPTAAAPTASLVFTRGARLGDDTNSLRLNQTVDRAWGGTTRAKKYGAGKPVYALSAIVAESSGSETDAADVVAFVDDYAEGAVNTVQWTDEIGTVRTVRILNDTVGFAKFGFKDGELLVATRFELEVQ
jgi:hypothetical protein